MKFKLILLLTILVASCSSVKRLDLVVLEDKEQEMLYIDVAPSDTAYFESYWNSMTDNGFRLKPNLATGRYDVYLDSALYYQAYYAKNQPSGTWVYYYRDTKKPLLEEPYKNGKKNGTAKMYTKDGKLAESGEYVNGNKEGIWLGYFEDGKTVSIKSYYKNDENYKTEVFYLSGKLESVSTYDEKGRYTTIHYDEQGNVINDE